MGGVSGGGWEGGGRCLRGGRRTGLLLGRKRRKEREERGEDGVRLNAEEKRRSALTFRAREVVESAGEEGDACTKKRRRYESSKSVIRSKEEEKSTRIKTERSPSPIGLV